MIELAQSETCYTGFVRNGVKTLECITTDISRNSFYPSTPRPFLCVESKRQHFFCT